MKTTSVGFAIVFSLVGAAWLGAQNRQPVILAGGNPLPAAVPNGQLAARQVQLDANGNLVVVYGVPGEVGGMTVVLPGQPPNRLFTNDLGEVGVFWAAPPAPVAAVVPPPPPVVTNAVPRDEPINRVFTNVLGEVGVFWANPVVGTNVVVPPNEPINRVFTNAAGEVGVFWGPVQKLR